MCVERAEHQDPDQSDAEKVSERRSQTTKNSLSYKHWRVSMKITDRKIKPDDAQAIRSMAIYWDEVVNRPEQESRVILSSELMQLVGYIGADVVLGCVASSLESE